MKKALIDPNTPVMQITGWVFNQFTKVFDPVLTEILNSDRVAEVSSADFPIAPPLFWVDCADDVVADQWYYNNITQKIIEVPPPAPTPDATVEIE